MGQAGSPLQGFRNLSPAVVVHDCAVNTQEAVMTDGVTIYESEPDEAIEALAQLDSAPRPSGRLLVAAVGGEPKAALPLGGGPAIADPFHPRGELVSLLELRREQMNGRPRRRRLAIRVGLLAPDY
jgi:hypothetical protein